MAYIALFRSGDSLAVSQLAEAGEGSGIDSLVQEWRLPRCVPIIVWRHNNVHGTSDIFLNLHMRFIVQFTPELSEFY